MEREQYDIGLLLEEWRKYELQQLRKYIEKHVDSPKRHPNNLYSIKKAVLM
ncbi:hypothetical protein ACIGHG_21500 [Bacillus sp. NPDC077411]|uniref:hypothetical protein n=1 Tax=Bacillus sp. NPDC077411 TaxID=3363947 RepID=UPI0037C6053E